ncbi:hypothetical protein AGMMS49944_05140 [Spirochaetia bacterium]|nr:hypothetical protein AGMMS49944_05140 [Spirochaetia bacterium]
MKVILLCLLSAAANVFLSTLAGRVLQLPLFLDTLFTVAITFAAGLVPGIVAAVLSIAISGSLYYEAPLTYFFVLCSIAEVVLVWMYRRRPGTGKEPLISTLSSLLLSSTLPPVLLSVF